MDDETVLVYASERYGVVRSGQTVEVPVGLSVLTLEQWALVSEQPRGAALVREVGGLEQSLADGWAAVPPLQAEDWIGRTRDRGAMEALLEVEQRAEVRAMLTARMVACGFSAAPRPRRRRVRRYG